VTSPLRHTPKGTYLHIRATPKAGRDEIVGLVVSPTGATSLAVKVTAIPDKGKANQAVIEVLAKTMHISKSSFRLSSGETARDKVLEVIANLSIVEAFLKTLSMQT
jgi:uncharacterized protein